MAKAGRPPNKIPTVKQSFFIPIHVKNALDVLFLDPLFARPTWGAKSAYITALIIEDLRRRGFNLEPPASLDSSDVPHYNGDEQSPTE